MLKSVLVAGAACFVMAFGSASAAEKSDLALYGRLPQYEEVKVSPDGSKLAMVMTNGDERFVIEAGKPVEFITLEGEDHWLSRGATRQKMLNETVAFVEKHNPPD